MVGGQTVVLPEAKHVVGVYANTAKTIGVIKIARPRVRNCLSLQTYSELHDHFHLFEKDAAVLAVIFTAEGDEFFTSGTDVGELGRLNAESLAMIRSIMLTLVNYPKILVAAVNGHAIGLGVSMLPYCDFAFAVPHATFRTPFMALGIVPDFGSSVTFPAMLGKVATNDLLLRGRKIDASRAVTTGLVTEIVPAHDFQSAVVALTEEVTGQLHANRSLLLFKKQIQRLRPLTKQHIIAAIDHELDEINRRMEARTVATAHSKPEPSRQPSASKL
ncbi:hypothetical protein H310_05551 [Aphanomyces invadans]|uniref:Enoyl-CoA hydratase n=1 Tax=Aphanomyces invadans TaxID=157072 RepID=A0A024UA23_9STRA|nr:hypothetical protein H310_05551 [Aphanomyces invadans]ETW03129.1 hypothetical protein H310_05551 [Aphanomyces invadans]|eukprot:XP_008868513.1 hypothetical protein H310_05551 [Aphanomyces invadans]